MTDIVKDVRRQRREMEELRQKAASQSAGAQGCICPPTSERTCKNPKCPRQDHRSLGQKMKDANRG
jgi:hypothetical protein